MKRKLRFPGIPALSLALRGLLLFLILPGIASPSIGNAETGFPDLSKFGYGARIDPWGQEIEKALYIASETGLDWISIDFDWGRQWPERKSTLNLAALNRVMGYASDHNLFVLISITHAPIWALTAHGPDPDLTAGLVAQLSRLYPEALLAVELFPSANLYRGWGAPPNPEAYSQLLKVTARTLKNTGRQTVLVATGLEPVLSGSSSLVGPYRQDMDDLVFLQRLYDAGAGDFLQIIGVRIPQTPQAPLAPPWKDDPRVLRHYESVRNIMLLNHHAADRIWITGFSMPGNLYAETSDTSPMLPNKINRSQIDQVKWFNQAMSLMKSQLYIGAVFYDCMNPAVNEVPGGLNHICFIENYDQKVSLHPAIQSLEQIISLENSDTSNQTTYVNQIFPPGSEDWLKASAP